MLDELFKELYWQMDYETPEYIEFELPGVKKEDVKIYYKNKIGMLLITVNAKDRNGRRINKVKAIESTGIDVRKIKAEYNDGLLILYLGNSKKNEETEGVIKIEGS